MLITNATLVTLGEKNQIIENGALYIEGDKRLAELSIDFESKRVETLGPVQGHPCDATFRVVLVKKAAGPDRHDFRFSRFAGMTAVASISTRAPGSRRA